ncbi:hypothetical protein ACVNF4_02295 [Streptomyces sp. S6]
MTPQDSSVPSSKPKPRAQSIEDTLWGSPAIFAFLAFLTFFTFRTDAGDRIGWILYFGGWIPAVGMGLWCAVTRRAPGVGGVFAPVLLVVAGFVLWLNHG